MEISSTKFAWIGSALCLDFVNTVGNRAGEIVSERLATWPDLIAWCKDAALLDERGTREIDRRFRNDHALAQRLLNTATQLREAIYRIFVAVTRRKSPEQIDLDILNEMLVRAPVTLRVQCCDASYTCTRVSSAFDDARLLGPIAWSAAELLESERLHLVRQCANAACRWLFLDLTKNHSRRWCDMGDCGSHEKARRYYARKKQAARARS
jgi:predicted RNA-binding Zn ribbon-like protein